MALCFGLFIDIDIDTFYILYRRDIAPEGRHQA